MQHNKKAGSASDAAKKRLNAEEWADCLKIIYTLHYSDKKKLQLLQAKGFDLNIVYASDGRSLLFQTCIKACIDGNLKPIRFLLKHSADANQATDDNVRPLFFAAQDGSLAIVKLLVEHGAEINFISHLEEEGGHSPLLAAVGENHENIAEYLLENGADPNLVHPKVLCFPLFTAAKNNNIKLSNLLLMHGAIPDSLNVANETPLHAAAENAAFGLIHLLLTKYNVNPNCLSKAGYSPLYYFLKCTNDNSNYFKLFGAAILNAFKEAGADFSLSYDNEPLLCLALKYNKLEFSKLLIESGCDVNQPGIQGTPLYIALLLDKRKFIELYIQAGANIHQYTPFINPGLKDERKLSMPYLHCAIMNENYFAAKLLLEKGIDVNAYSHSEHELQETKEEDNFIYPLDLLVINCVSHYRENADTNSTQSFYQCAALHLACTKGNLRLVKFLCLTYGANINAKAENGETPLFLAAQQGHLPIVAFLLETYPKELKVNEGRNGTIPLFIANLYKHREVVKYLLEKYYIPLYKNLYKEQIKYELLEHCLLNDSEHQEQSIKKLLAILYPENPKRINKEDDKAIPHLPHMPVPEQISSHHFLSTQGLYSSEEIRSLKEERCKDEPEKEERETITNIEISWLDGLITSSMPEIQAIDAGTSHKTPNCFFYLDTQGLLKQGCDIETFKNIVLRFSAAKNENGLKSLKGETKCIDITFGQEKIQAKLLWSLKKKSIKERVLCFSLSSDDGKHTLIVGAFYYAKGLKSYDVSLWRTPSNKAHKVYLPPSAKARKKAKQQATLAK